MVKPKKSDAPHQVIVICNVCDTRQDMFARGDQQEQVTCGCGRVVRTFLRPGTSAKISKTPKGDRNGTWDQ